MIILIVLLSSCFPPVPGRSEKTADNPNGNTISQTPAEYHIEKKPSKTQTGDTIRDMAEKRIFQDPVTISVEQWPGKTFIILEKVEMFRKFGHYLYTTPEMDKNPSAGNPEIEHPNHRLKYKPFAGRTIKVLETELKPDGEFLITALTDTLNLTVYAKTCRGVVEGLLLRDDLTEAGFRWTGTRIYSRRRLIDTYDSTKSKFSNVKVSILEPLTVVSVRPGIIPLPPKPIWLIVQRTDSTIGIIPLNWSWTNTLTEKQISARPWDEDILEQNPAAAHPDWEKYAWETIDKHNVYKGMNSAQVLHSWGNPQSRKNLDSTAEEWIFQNSRLVLKNDSLALIEER